MEVLKTSFGAQMAEVQVDKETGLVRVLKLTTAHEGGQPINPMLVEGQIHGSAHMALGQAISEQMVLENGRVLNPSFGDYKIFNARDIPEMEVIEVVTYEPEGPFGAKEAGEGLTAPTSGAVANAVLHATGFVVNRLPITAEIMSSTMKMKK